MGMQNARRGGGAFRTAGIFALGAAVGSIVALFYAPASGQVTRRRLANRIRTLRRDTVRQLEQTGRTLTRKAGDVREAATAWLSDHMPARNGKQALRRRPIRHAHAA